MEETSVHVLRLVLVALMIGVVIFGGTTLAYFLEGRPRRLAASPWP